MSEHSVRTGPHNSLRYHTEDACDIAILTYDFRASGVVRNALRIGRALADAGLAVEHWVCRADGDLTPEAEDSVVRSIRLDGRRCQRDLDSLASIRSLTRMMTNTRPKVLMSAGNQMHIHAAIALRMTPRIARPRFVGRASNAIVDNGQDRKTWRSIVGAAERLQFGAMDRIIAVSEELANDLITCTGATPSRVAVVPNGVDHEEIHAKAIEKPACNAVEPDKPYILGVGRLSRQKDFETLIRAYALTRSVAPQLNLVIAGCGPDNHARSLQKLANRKGVGDTVHLVGYQQNPLALMRKAEVFVSSSRWEGSSNVILEALACGVPVVSTAAPTGVREVLEPDDLAPLTPVGDAPALADAILKRMRAPRNADRLIARAKEYSMRDTLDGYVSVLGEEVSLSHTAPAKPYNTVSKTLNA